MGSLGAMSSRGKKSYSKDRYFQADVSSDDKIVPGASRPGRLSRAGRCGDPPSSSGVCTNRCSMSAHPRSPICRLVADSCGSRLLVCAVAPHDISGIVRAPNYTVKP